MGPPVLILPFVLLLGAMAIAPVLAPRWWSRFYAPVALGLGGFMVGIYLFVVRDPVSLGGAAREYLSFMAVGVSLFVVAGGIRIVVPGAVATPSANALFLLLGAVAANFMGTTGAAMLLIRPWIELNRSRIAAYHIAFFIFLIANVGGCLTPIGDPPLFLGYLQGIPFWWVAAKCWPMWALATGLLLAIFYGVDKFHFARAPVARERSGDPQSWRLEGGNNLFFLAVILGTVFIDKPIFLREGLMLAAAAGSYFTTKKSVHDANGFNFHPIVEVGILFAGIFATMVPALSWLEHRAGYLMGPAPSAGAFFWGTGTLSALLDNAPTYLAFMSALQGAAGTADVPSLLAQKTASVLAVSVASVFFGAATYIGNGPNFMVKAIAEQNRVPMPSFLHFMLRYSLPILLPVLGIIWLVFFKD